MCSNIKMEVVIDHVVDIPLELYNTSWLQSLEAFCVLYTWYFKVSLHVSGWQSGLRVLQAMWSGKLSDSYTTAVYVYYKTGRRNCT